MDALQSQLRARYLDPKQLGAFTGRKNFSQHIGQNPSSVAKVLEHLPVYTRFRNRRKHFQRRKVRSYFSGDVFCADILDLSRFSRANRGFKYILVCVDVHSKRVYAEALKTKSGLEVARSLMKIFTQAAKPPKNLFTDQG